MIELSSDNSCRPRLGNPFDLAGVSKRCVRDVRRRPRGCLMREFAFDIEYEPGVDAVMDVFIEHPTLVAEALHGCVTEDRIWRIERLIGPTAALDEVERLRFDGTVRAASVTEADCSATRYHDVLDRSDDERVIYTHVEDTGGGESVQTLAARYLPHGSLYCTTRRGSRHSWRIFVRSDEKVGCCTTPSARRCGRASPFAWATSATPTVGARLAGVGGAPPKTANYHARSPQPRLLPDATGSHVGRPRGGTRRAAVDALLSVASGGRTARFGVSRRNLATRTARSRRLSRSRRVRPRRRRGRSPGRLRPRRRGRSRG